MNSLLLLSGALLLLIGLTSSTVIYAKCENNETGPHLTREEYSGYEKQITDIKYENCRIKTIDKDTLHGLFNLKHFELNNNGAEVTLAPELFVNSHKIEKIILRKDIIVHEGTFKNLSHLKVLILEHNAIGILPKQLLWHLPALEILSLRNNFISKIDEDAFNLNEEFTSLSFYKQPEVFVDVLFENRTKLDFSFDNVKHIQLRIFTINLKLLDISMNNLTDLPENIFNNLTQLEALNLYHNQLSSVPKKLFSNLGLLKKLDLSTNLISSLDPDTFAHNTELIELILRENQLTELQAGLFQNLNNLQYLYLQTNLIQRIEEKVFPSSANYIQVDLQYNKLETLNVTVFEDLPSNAELNLFENPWICDCRIDGVVRLWQKLMTSQVMFYVPKCVSPEEFTIDGWYPLNVDRLCSSKD